jgi:hypothetical protein
MVTPVSLILGAHGILQQLPDEINHLITMHLTNTRDLDDERLASVGRWSHGSNYKFDLGVLKFLRRGLSGTLRIAGKVIEGLLPRGSITARQE